MSSATVRPEAGAHEHDPVRKGVLWAAVLGGPIIVLANLEVLYLLVPWSCRNGAWVLHAGALASVLLVVVTLAAAWHSWSRARGGWPDAGEGAESRTRFLAVLGLLTGTLSLTVLVAQWLPVLVLDPCVGAG
jgi:hypothetical protein